MQLEEMLIQWNKGVSRGAKAKLAQKLEVSEPTVSRWLKLDLNPSEENIKKMSKIFKKSEAEIKAIFKMEPKESTYKESDFIQTTWIPVMGVVSAEMFNCVPENAAPEEVLPVPISDKDIYALKVKGNCMSPKIKDGEYVLIRRQPFAYDGQLVVARVDGECTLKLFYKKGDKVELKPYNPEHKTILKHASEVEIVGKVISVMKNNF